MKSFLRLILLVPLSLVSAVNDFVPLSCNANLASAVCNSWTSIFGSSSTFTSQIIIPCGTCVQMNHPGPELSLLGGINIIGKLIFPNDGSYTLTINTASIIVQGELDMQSTLTPVTGTPLLRIVMIGFDEKLSFRPVNENANACPNFDCEVGFKSITVAGGKVNLNGLPPSTLTWVKLHNVAGGTANNPTALIVSASIQNKWSVGADVLITSHTRDWTDQQVRKIVSIAPARTPSGYVQINLNASIRRPTTIVESVEYAVEVALLSRNILLEGGPDPSDGGHFWILSTPRVIQIIEGIEIKQFGQQGTLGRYPIHYHLSSNAIGSKIVKNSIRKSHQRCIVIHGTDNVLVQENIAYDTLGHCFMLEDGIETGNMFKSNLGALTGTPAKIIPDNEETDDQPATFWITNPTNYFNDNIAAGSNSSGFWFELKKRGPRAVLYPSPVALPLGSFSGNVAHSNVAAKGAFRMYPGGYRPLVQNKATLTNLKGYRNLGRGMYIHLCHNIDLTNSHFADNDISVDVDRAEAIGLYGLRIIGKSDSFGALIAREPKLRDICNRARGRTIGLDVHTWRPRQSPGGLIVKDTNFEEFDEVTCPGVAPIIVDSETQIQGLFELFTTFENVVAQGGSSAVDLCEATTSAQPIESIYLIDIDGSFRPAGVNPTSPSSMVSTGKSMMTFVNTQKCTAISGRCYNYCADTCFRSVRFDVGPKGTENFKLKVCQRSNPSKCVTFGGGVYYDVNLVYNDIPRIFFAHLPAGSYNAVFLNGSGGEDWPSFVKMEIEPALCSATVDIILREPPVATSQCQQLIRNGNVDASSIEPLFWLTALGGLELVRSGGVGGSNAVGGTKFGTTQLFQYVDNRCFTTGGRFTISADMKLLDQNGTLTTCKPSSENCPTVGIYAESATYTDIAEVGPTIGSNGFQRATGVFDVDPFVATSPSVYFYVKSTRTRRLVVDNFSVVSVSSAPIAVPAPVKVSVPYPIYYSPKIVPVAQPSPKAGPVVFPSSLFSPIPPPSLPLSFCSNLISNSDMERGYEGYWLGSLENVNGGFNGSALALKHVGRLASRSPGPSYNTTLVDKSCFTPGSIWEVSAQVRLVMLIFNRDAGCDIGSNCPAIRLILKDTAGQVVANIYSRNYPSGTWRSSAFNSLSTTFQLPSTTAWNGSVGSVEIGIRGYRPTTRHLIFDNFVVRKIS